MAEVRSARHDRRAWPSSPSSGGPSRDAATWRRRSCGATSSTAPSPTRCSRGRAEVGSDLVMPEKGMLSDELRDRARAAGLKVATWVVDEPEELRDLAALRPLRRRHPTGPASCSTPSGPATSREPADSDDERVDDQARGQLRMEERALGGHRLPRLGHVHDLPDRRSAHEDRESGSCARQRLLGLAPASGRSSRPRPATRGRAPGRPGAGSRCRARAGSGGSAGQEVRGRGQGLGHEGAAARPGEGEGVGRGRAAASRGRGRGVGGIGHAERPALEAPVRLARATGPRRGCGGRAGRRSPGASIGVK